MMMPALVLVSAESGLRSKRACKGLNFMVFPLSGTGAAYRKQARQVSTRQLPLQLGGRRGIQRHRQAGYVTLVLAAAHVAVAVKPGDGDAVAQRDGDFAGGPGAQPVL